MKRNLGKISILTISLLTFIILVNVMQSDETIPRHIKEEPVSEQEQSDKLFDLDIDEEGYRKYFNNLLIDGLTYSESRIVELLERAAISVNPKGDVEIPSLEKIDDYFKGSMNEFSLLKQESENGSPSIIITQTPKSGFALKEAIGFIDNEQISKDLETMADALLEINYIDLSSIQEFINAYDRYASIQKKIIEIHHLYIEVEKEITLKPSETNQTTFGAELSKVLDGEKIKDIRITVFNDRTIKYVKITDEETVNQVLYIPSDMELEKTEDYQAGDAKNISISTMKWRDILVEVFEHQIYIGDTLYKINGENSLWKTIEQLDVEWESFD
ncbi:hypothetical protein [Ornithinibacillus halotolerans]|uniref:Uncharacterized protein n=1 Tax=Ornithinibacillus halotolerans TaxID=1274357 RepID=A0A916WCX3_9BACI|nr:hypothetical protein [Ornithinibacillus halotolerans]GGA86971.1 hypothetical protein GCM10008025_32320 [Ornithinibacillus halotolerans]